MPGLRKNKTEREAFNAYKGILSNYCGIGGYGIPQHKIDFICQQHDRDYAIIQHKKGTLWPYLHYNWADERMLRKIRFQFKQNGMDMFARERAIGQIANSFFSAKKHWATLLQEEYDADVSTAVDIIRSFPNLPTNQQGTS